ncbi:ABC-F family ATP-binding cassette domain-containing protein, partial [bacterium]|nr:ABC-F family ATP-binding cassette domain-containing protein [candidate division CSSED10-310 bacterium]
NLLLLDEPTNHLDMAGREVLEEALCLFPGAVILVSHDRYLLDKVVNKIWWLTDRGIREYPGNYSEYRDQRLVEQQGETAPVNEDVRGRDRRLSKKEMRQQRAQDRRLHGPGSVRLEADIAELEKRLQEIRMELYDGRHGADWETMVALQAEEKDLARRIEGLLVEWEKAVEREERLEEENNR